MFDSTSRVVHMTLLHCSLPSHRDRFSSRFPVGRGIPSAVSNTLEAQILSRYSTSNYTPWCACVSEVIRLIVYKCNCSTVVCIAQALWILLFLCNQLGMILDPDSMCFCDACMHVCIFFLGSSKRLCWYCSEACQRNPPCIAQFGPYKLLVSHNTSGASLGHIVSIPEVNE